MIAVLAARLSPAVSARDAGATVPFRFDLVDPVLEVDRVPTRDVPSVSATGSVIVFALVFALVLMLFFVLVALRSRSGRWRGAFGRRYRRDHGCRWVRAVGSRSTET